MDHHGVLGRWLSSGHAQARGSGGDVHCHHPEGGGAGPGLPALPEEAAQRCERLVSSCLPYSAPRCRELVTGSNDDG